MCAEGLSAIIWRNEGAGLSHGCQIAKGAPIISHLLFADDCYLFFKATRAEAHKKNITKVCRYLWTCDYYNKSAITFSSNTNIEDREEVCAQLEVKEKDDPGKYLGMPMKVGRNKSSVFSFLVNRVDQKL